MSVKVLEELRASSKGVKRVALVVSGHMTEDNKDDLLSLVIELLSQNVSIYMLNDLATLEFVKDLPVCLKKFLTIFKEKETELNGHLVLCSKVEVERNQEFWGVVQALDPGLKVNRLFELSPLVPMLNMSEYLLYDSPRVSGDAGVIASRYVLSAKLSPTKVVDLSDSHIRKVLRSL